MDSGLVVVLWLAFGAIGAAIGNSKGKPGAGLALGLLLGLIGVIIAIFLSPSPEKRMEEQRQMQSIYGGQQTLYGGQQGPQTSPSSPAGWFPDPHHRAELRYWNGLQWTGHISSGGVQSVEGLAGASVASSAPKLATVSERKCEICGTSVAVGAAFCSGCGRALS